MFLMQSDLSEIDYNIEHADRIQLLMQVSEFLSKNGL